MRKTLLFLLLCIFILKANAQKRNIFYPIGFNYDNLISSDQDEDILMLTNKFSLTAGYERLIGNCVSVGLKYVRYIGTQGDGVEAYFEYENVPGSIYESRTAMFNENAQGFVYESKYFFDYFDEDGPNSIYLGIMFSNVFVKESYTKIKGTDLMTGSTVNYPDQNNSYSVPRVGLKYGQFFSGAVSFEYFVAAYMNLPKGKEDLFDSPTQVKDFSFSLGMTFGIPTR